MSGRSATSAARILYRRNSTISLPRANKATFAIPMKSPCSTTPGMSLNSSRQLIRIANLAKAAIQNVMILVGHVGLAIGALAHRNLGAQFGDPLGHQRLGEADHFHRQRKLPQHRHLLRGVGHDHQLLRRRRDNFLPQHGAAAALDQAQLRIDFVRAIDGDVDLLAVVERGQRNPQARGQLPDFTEVGMPRMRSPFFTRSASSLMKNAAVDPVPRPTTCPSFTNCKLARAAASFS